jgi:hypothetical protein
MILSLRVSEILGKISARIYTYSHYRQAVVYNLQQGTKLSGGSPTVG